MPSRSPSARRDRSRSTRAANHHLLGIDDEVVGQSKERCKGVRNGGLDMKNPRIKKNKQHTSIGKNMQRLIHLARLRTIPANPSYSMSVNPD